MKKYFTILMSVLLITMLSGLSAQTIDDMDGSINRFYWTVTTQTADDYGYVPDGETGLPEHLFDGDAGTFLALVKPGKSFQGKIEAAGWTPSFTIDLGYPETFNMMLWGHRSTNSYIYLRVFGVEIEVSDDGVNFEPLGEEGTIYWIPNKGGYTGGAQVKDEDIHEIPIPEVTTQYIRIYLVKYSDNYVGGEAPFSGPQYSGDGAKSGSTMQVAEFGLKMHEGLLLTDLNLALSEANDVTEEKYPVGDAEAEYGQSEWDALVNVRTQAQSIYDAALENDPAVSQDDVDAVAASLRVALDEFYGSQNDLFFASTGGTIYWYTINDRRSKSSYWEMSDDNIAESGTALYRVGMVEEKPYEITDKHLFKFVTHTDGNGYFIFSKTNETNALYGSGLDEDFFGLKEGESSKWLTENAPAKGYSFIGLENEEGALGGDMLNSKIGRTPKYIGFWNNRADAGNQWRFTREATETSVKHVAAQSLDIFVSGRKIMSRNAEDTLLVFNVHGQQLNAKQSLTPGVYIVRIADKSEVAKILVK